jgi:hypothetical protein
LNRLPGSMGCVVIPVSVPTILRICLQACHPETTMPQPQPTATFWTKAVPSCILHLFADTQKPSYHTGGNHWCIWRSYVSNTYGLHLMPNAQDHLWLSKAAFGACFVPPHRSTKHAIKLPFVCQKELCDICSTCWPYAFDAYGFHMCSFLPPVSLL